MAKKKEPRQMLTTSSVPAVPAPADSLPTGYAELLDELKTRIRTAQIKAVIAANRELLLLYWGIGRDILRRQAEQGWGAKVIDRLGDELRRAFPDLKGLSPRNFKYMRALAAAFPDEAFVQEALAQITWYHAITITEKVKDAETRVWYVRKAIEHGWSRNVLALQDRQQAARTAG